MFEFDENKYFDETTETPETECIHPERPPFHGFHTHPHEKPRYTMTEEFEHLKRHIQISITRILKFEERLKHDFDSLSSHLTTDNVVFKDTLREAWAEFVNAVKTEVSLFEKNMESMIELNQTEVESNYANLVENINERFDAYKTEMQGILSNYNELHSEIFAEFSERFTNRFNTLESELRADYESFKTEIRYTINEHTITVNNRLTNQDNKIDEAYTHMRANLNEGIEFVLEEMKAEGRLAGILDSHLFATPEQYGAVGDNKTNNYSAFDNLFSSAEGNKFIRFKQGATYVTSKFEIPLLSDTHIDGNGATISTGNFGGTYMFKCDTEVKNIIIENLTFKSSSGIGLIYVSCGGTVQAGPMTRKIYPENITLRNVTIETTGRITSDPVQSVFFGNVKNLLIENCKFISKSTSEESNAVTVWSDEEINDNAKGIVIRNNKVKGFYRGINSYGTGTNGTGNRQLMTIEGNTFEGCISDAIYCYHAPGSKIINNYIMGCGKGIFADSGTNIDIDGYVENNTFTNLVSGNSINTCEVGIYTEELQNGVVSSNLICKCSEAGIIIGGGSNYAKFIGNSIRECYDGIVLDMGYTNISYYINNPEIESNTFIRCGRHGVFLKNTNSAFIKNNVFRFWGESDDEERGLQSSAIRIENKCGVVGIIGNVFDNKIVSTYDETAFKGYTCISDASAETYKALTICENSFEFAEAFIVSVIEIVNYSAYRYIMNNRFRRVNQSASVRIGYEDEYIHHNNGNALVDAVGGK